MPCIVSIIQKNFNTNQRFSTGKNALYGDRKTKETTKPAQCLCDPVAKTNRFGTGLYINASAFFILYLAAPTER